MADLARLDISEADKKKYAKQLSAILDYFAQLQTVDTTGVGPLAQVFDLKNVWQPDRVHAEVPIERLLAEAPQVDGRLIKVCSVLPSKKKAMRDVQDKHTR